MKLALLNDMLIFKDINNQCILTKDETVIKIAGTEYVVPLSFYFLFLLSCLMYLEYE